MIRFSAVTLLCGSLLLGGCMQDVGTKQTLGGLGGAVAGGVLGSQFGKGDGQLWMTGLGVALGALAGSEVGKSLDRADKMYMARTTQNTLESIPSGQTQQWNNPDSGASGTITPQRTWTNNDGRNCREFQQTVTIGGRTETAYGTACRDNAGGWQIVQ